MKQFKQISLTIALVLILTALVNGVTQWTYSRSLHSSLDTICKSVVQYLQIGSYRTAQEIVSAGIKAFDPALKVKFEFENVQSNPKEKTVISTSCNVPGREDQNFRIQILSSKDLVLKSMWRLFWSLVFSIGLFTFAAIIFSTSVKILRQQLNIALENSLGLNRQIESFWYRVIGEIPALKGSKAAIEGLTDRVRIETEKVLSLEMALGRRRAISKYLHDIRSPIGALRILVQKKKGLLSPEESSMMDNILGRLVDIPQLGIDAEKVALQQETSDNGILFYSELNFVLHIVLQRIKLALAPSSDVSFQIYLPEMQNEKSLQITAIEFDRLLTNLTDNAKSAGASRIAITVSLSELENQILMVVDDNGPGGLSQDLTPISNSNSRKGLGLEIVKEIATKAQATFSVHSPMDVGTKISFSMPLVAKTTSI